MEALFKDTTQHIKIVSALRWQRLDGALLQSSSEWPAEDIQIDEEMEIGGGARDKKTDIDMFNQYVSSVTGCTFDLVRF